MFVFYYVVILDDPIGYNPYDGRFYMVPESSELGEVRVYESCSFPTKWRFKKTILVREGAADPTIFQHEDRWWMFIGRAGSHDQLQLFMADDLFGKWTEHPKSPLFDSDSSRSRPAGGVVRANGKLFRLAQDCTKRYGEAVRAFEIKSLTVDDYDEVECRHRLLGPQDHSWNSHGMHHFSSARTSHGTWLIAVDGHFKRWHIPWR